MGKCTCRQIVGLVALLLICCAGCAKDTTSNTDHPSSSSTTTQQAISVDEAEKKVKANLPETPYTFHISFEREETIKQRNYYYFHVYTLSAEPIIGPDGPFYQQFTYAWIYVDSETGDLYELESSGNVLKPWGKEDIGQGPVIYLD